MENDDDFFIPFEKYLNHFPELLKREKNEIIDFYALKKKQKTVADKFLKAPDYGSKTFWKLHFDALVEFWLQFFFTSEKENMMVFSKLRKFFDTLYKVCLERIQECKKYRFSFKTIKLLFMFRKYSPSHNLLFLIFKIQEKRAETIELQNGSIVVCKFLYKYFFLHKHTIMTFLSQYRCNDLYVPVFEFCVSKPVPFCLDIHTKILEVCLKNFKF